MIKEFHSSNFTLFAKVDRDGYIDLGCDYGPEKHSQRLMPDSVLPLVYWLLEWHFTVNPEKK